MKFEAPDMEIVYLHPADIVTASSGEENGEVIGGGGNGTPITNEDE